MKVKITATISYETEFTVADYSEIENGPKTEGEIIPFEMKALEEGDDVLTQSLIEAGKLSDIKIEKLEDTAAPAAEEAA